jgi:hypothetical protein
VSWSASPSTDLGVVATIKSSPFAKRTAAQVIFAEQFLATQTVWAYYVFRP